MVTRGFSLSAAVEVPRLFYPLLEEAILKVEASDRLERLVDRMLTNGVESAFEQINPNYTAPPKKRNDPVYKAVHLLDLLETLKRIVAGTRDAGESTESELDRQKKAGTWFMEQFQAGENAMVLDLTPEVSNGDRD